MAIDLIALALAKQYTDKLVKEVAAIGGKFVSYDKKQTLTDEQKARARDNIDAIDESEVNELRNELKEEISEVSDNIVQSDWNQNDETALDFVKNRTHYSKPCTIYRTFEATSSDGHSSYDLELVNLLWDNADKATYTIKKIGKEESEIYTNPTIIELSPVSKKIELASNYYVSINKETGWFNFGEPTGNGNFESGSIYLNTEQIVQLDEKFIPDTIARVSDIPSGGNTDQSDLSAELKTALVNYYTHVTPSFDDDNGLAYINAILTALGAEIRDAI